MAKSALLLTLALAALVSGCADDDRGVLVEATVDLGTRTAEFREAKWQLSPGFEPDADSRTLRLVAVDNCGLVSEGAEVVVLASYSESSVTLTVFEALTTPQPEGQEFYGRDCAIGARVTITVELAEPLGDRTIVGEHSDLRGWA